jgi:hypothetical protein
LQDNPEIDMQMDKKKIAEIEKMLRENTDELESFQPELSKFFVKKKYKIQRDGLLDAKKNMTIG